MFPELSLHADAIAATIFFCAILSKNKAKLSRMFDELPRTYIYQEKVNFTDDLTYYSTNIETFLHQHFGNFEKLHARLYLASVNESKLLLRQSPFDKYAMNFTDANFEEKVLNSEIPVLVDFWASWCPPCKMTEPLIDKLAQEYNSKVKIGKINVDQNPRTSAEYRIKGVPTFVTFQSGKIVERLVAAQTEGQLRKMLNAVCDGE